MRKIISVIGARPQFIKTSMVSNKLNLLPNIEEIIIHTGQHFDKNMSDIFFQQLNIPKPKYNLNINSGNHGEMTGKMIIELEKVLLIEKPDLVILYGDTNSTLAGAISASKLKIPIAHIESGLRSFCFGMPEEINRIVTDRLSTLLFTPSEIAANQLKNEGVDPLKIFTVGDVMYDAALYYGSLSNKNSISNKLIRNVITSKKYCLVTVHRAENTDEVNIFNIIIKSLNRLSQDLKVIFPIHPRSLKVLKQLDVYKFLSSNFIIIDPVSFLEMIELEKNASLIITDSGGVQKEAFFYKVPCVTIRNETEWTELIDFGWNKLSPPSNSDKLYMDYISMLGIKGKKNKLYGNGDSANQIVKTIQNYFA